MLKVKGKEKEGSKANNGNPKQGKKRTETRQA